MLKVQPKLAPGHELPKKPVYWNIVILDENTKKPHHSRGTWEKYLTPQEAAKEAYGIPPTENMVFFNMSSSVVQSRKMLKEVRKFWEQHGGS